MATEITEYSQTEAALSELRNKYDGVVFDVATPKEMKAAKEARAEVRGYRVDLEKKRKEIKAPALERCRMIDSEAKRITSALVEIEGPIDETIKAEEARKEEERLAKVEAERERVEAIERRIQSMRDLPASLTGESSKIIAGVLKQMRDKAPTENEFEEYFTSAQDAHAAAVARVEQQLQAQEDHEAEQEKIAAERAELERMRAENERLQREADERAAAERAEADRAAREKREREAAAQRAREKEERAEREAKERAERESREKELQAERERQAAEQKRLDEEAAKLKREREAAAKKAEADRLANIGLREAAQNAADFLELEGYGDHQCFVELTAALDNDATGDRAAT